MLAKLIMEDIQVKNSAWVSQNVSCIRIVNYATSLNNMLDQLVVYGERDVFDII